mgnify:FL=1
MGMRRGVDVTTRVACAEETSVSKRGGGGREKG